MTIRGANIPCYPMNRGGELTTLDHFKRAYDELQQVGGNAVALNPVHYMSTRSPQSVIIAPPHRSYGTQVLIWDDLGQGQLHPWPQTASEQLIREAAQEAKSRNLYVMLKPMEDWEHGGWRGYISVKGDNYDLTNKWLYAYRRKLKRYARIGIETKADCICLGTEMLQVTKELGPKWVVAMKQYLRNQGYKGEITYAANWGAHDAEYNLLGPAWPFMSYVGVDAYFPLIPHGDEITYQAALDGWHTKTVDADWWPYWDYNLEDVGGTSWVATEIGYRADSDAAFVPFADPSNGVYQPEAQELLWQVFRDKWEGKMRGYFAWSWELHPQYDDARSHNLRGRAASHIALGPY